MIKPPEVEVEEEFDLSTAAGRQKWKAREKAKAEAEELARIVAEDLAIKEEKLAKEIEESKVNGTYVEPEPSKYKILLLYIIIIKYYLQTSYFSYKYMLIYLNYLSI